MQRRAATAPYRLVLISVSHLRPARCEWSDQCCVHLLRRNLADVLEGAPIARLADLLRVSAGRVVVDKTGLAGSYHVTSITSSGRRRIRPTGHTGRIVSSAP